MEEKHIIKECKTHGNTTHFREKDKESFYYRCSQCKTDRTRNLRNSFKLKALEYKGNKCETCSYDKCIQALEFHHVDPSKKYFSIAEKGYRRSWADVILELDKTILVCANCHREIHSQLLRG